MSSRLIVNTIRHNGASSDAVTLASDGTCTANITNKPNRNLIINGAMQVAQRGTSSTSTGVVAVDRVRTYHVSTDEAPTYSQVDVASGTTPYSLGLRKAYRVTNGNQTSGVAATNQIQLDYLVEAQDLACSGWDHKSPSSFLTLSYWAKSSVAQEFKAQMRTVDGTPKNFAYSLGSLAANTWTKVTILIPGNSNLQIDNDNGTGLEIGLFSQWGTNLTANSVSENAWGAYSGSARTPDQTLTWYTTNDATFEITGVQLEVGSVATDFEHRSFNDEYLKCCRYYQSTTTVPSGSAHNAMAGSSKGGSAIIQCANAGFKTLMRTNPTTIIYNGTDSNKVRSSGGGNITLNSPTIYAMPHGINVITVSSGLTQDEWYQFNYTCDAEL